MIQEVLIFILIFILLKCLLALIRMIRGNNFLDIIRVILFFVPFILPAAYYGLPNVHFKGDLIFYFLCIIASILALWLKYQEFKPYIDKSLYKLLPPLTFKKFLILEISFIGSAIFEEIFYRFYVPHSHLITSMILSGLIFSLAHYIQNYTRGFFDLKTYFLLFFLSIIWYFSYVKTGSLLPAILGHLTYNLPSIIITARHYMISRKNVSKEEFEAVKGDF